MVIGDSSLANCKSIGIGMSSNSYDTAFDTVVELDSL